jgi:hypothetical protein
MEEQWQDGQNKGGKKTNNIKEKMWTQTGRTHVLMKYKVLKKAVNMKDCGKNQ